VFKLEGGQWAYRLARDEDGCRRQVGGFKTKGEAREACDNHVDRILNPQRRDSITLAGLVDEYLGQHVAEQNTLATLAARLKHAAKAFGDLPLERLAVAEIAAWRKRLPKGSAWHILKALRQALHYAVVVGLLMENPAVKVKNPEPKRREAQAFGSWAEVEAVAAEFSPAFAAVPVVAAGTGLRPSEWIALLRALAPGCGRVRARPPRCLRHTRERGGGSRKVGVLPSSCRREAWRHRHRETRKPPPTRGFSVSGRRDLNSGPLVPQTSALTRLRHAPLRD
jgi:hypothetical protein